MAGFEQERKNIYTHFYSNFRMDIPVAYDNQKPNFVPEEQDVWVRISILNGARDQISMGDTKVIRSIGVVSFQIFARENKGSTDARTIADAISNVFDLQRVENMQFKTSYIGGILLNQGFYQLNLNVPYFRNEIV